MIKYPDYKHSILNVSTTILNHYGILTDYAILPKLAQRLEGKKHIILLLLDGMGSYILDNLDKKTFLRSHVIDHITSVYPPTTVAATTSVLTGLPPWVHGHVGWVQYNRYEDSNTVVFLNEDFYDETKVLKHNFRKTYLNKPTILDQIQHKYPKLSVNRLFPDFEVGGYHTFPQMIDALIKINQKDASMSYAYWTEPDHTIHESGTHTKEVESLLEDLNEEVERLSKNLNNDTALIIIADHGLIDVKPYYIHEHPTLEKYFYRKPSIEARSTAFFVKQEYKKAFLKYFKREFKTFKLFTKEQIYQRKLLGEGKKHPLMDDFIGDYVAIAKGNYMFNMVPGEPFKAHHAGINKKEMCVSLIYFEHEKNA